MVCLCAARSEGGGSGQGSCIGTVNLVLSAPRNGPEGWRDGKWRAT